MQSRKLLSVILDDQMADGQNQQGRIYSGTGGLTYGLDGGRRLEVVRFDLVYLIGMYLDTHVYSR